ncbi:hypothetical protein BG015_001212 [Linnemannia schmuckeri]|uniref:Uncharacterized protein n=1 Tax=Linnemannia schmuckeri TaxID=64567 RepID=A0A9P5V747_9FUNG|nr:hypothetical protein BG015_001212 [Linnemannia schmuckeri]
MKFDKIFSLSWSVLGAVLLTSIGAASNNMVLAVPGPSLVADLGSIRVRGQYPTGVSKRAIPASTETVRIAVPTKGPFRFRPPLIDLPVESPVLYKRQDDDITKTVPKSHEMDPVEKDKGPKRKRDLPSTATTTTTNTPEKEFKSESVNGSDFSKRRAMPNSWIRWISSGGFNV